LLKCSDRAFALGQRRLPFRNGLLEAGDLSLSFGQHSFELCCAPVLVLQQSLSLYVEWNQEITIDADSTDPLHQEFRIEGAFVEIC
jgi:hypothetical protein